MNKVSLTIYMVLCPILFVFGQKTNNPPLTEIQKLASLGKVWGFLKYYHPSVSKGRKSPDWDSVLISKVPLVRQCKDTKELSSLYENWIDALGEVPKCTRCQTPKDSVMDNFDLRITIDETLFTTSLINKLDYIRENRAVSPYWIGQVSGVGNITLEKEKTYNDMVLPTEEYRLLSLYRFWNIIHYFFPYKYVIGRDWNGALDEYIPKFINAKDTASYHRTCTALVAELNDSHANYQPPPKAPRFYDSLYVPFFIKIIDNQAVVNKLRDDSLCKILDIRVGDIITKIDDESIEVLQKKFWHLTGASNEAIKKRNLANVILLGNTPQYKMDFIRNGAVQTKTSQRFSFKKMKSTSGYGDLLPFKEIDGDIGYIHLGVLKSTMIDSMFDILGKKKALIIDVRNYPNWVIFPLSEKLKPTKSPFVKFTTPNLNYAGMYQWTSLIETGKDNPDYFKGKVVVICNEATQSQAEYTIMSLQTAPNVTTIGSQTAGADGNVSTVPFVGGGNTWISGIGVFYPDGRPTQRVGIKVDIEVKPTAKGIAEGRDEVLEKAIEIAKQ